jgi:polyisoprenoid-binding protein YceI
MSDARRSSTTGEGFQEVPMSWQLDPYHTQVEFSARHLGMMTVRRHSPR